MNWFGLRSKIWTSAEAARILEIQDEVGKASAFKDVDPWGEVAATHLAKLTEGLNLCVGHARRVKDHFLQTRSTAAKLYLESMELLHGVSDLLQQLTLADPAYYRDILQTPDTVSPEEYRAALLELAKIQELEDRIRQELSKT